MPNLDECNNGGYVTIDPPKLEKLSGRPRRNREKGVDEGQSILNDAKRSSMVRCDTCKEFGHRKHTYQRVPVKKV